jgi:hypothetical protein
VSIEKGYCYLDGKNPDGDGDVTFRIAKKQVDHFREHGPAHMYHALKSVQEVLKAPSVIFEGLKRPDKENGLCYCGTPRRYLNEDIEAPPPPGKVFTVYIDKNRVIFEWRWDKADEFQPNFPKDPKHRFDKLKWKA